MPPFTTEPAEGPSHDGPPADAPSRTRAAFHEGTLRKFLSYIVDPAAGATELRILNAQYDNTGNAILPNDKFSTTLSAWYDNANSIVTDARKLRGASAYICLNPTSPDLLARSYNRLRKVRAATSDDDIVCLRWFYIDVDPVRQADISATQAELDLAVAKRDIILADHPEIARVSLVGKSGNGAFIMARMPDYPNDLEHRTLVANALDSLIARYSDSAVKIDAKTKNPSRVGCVPGTLKCKGSHVPNRQWKMATLDGVPAAGPDEPPGTIDLKGWLERNPAPVAQVRVAGGGVPAIPYVQRASISPPWSTNGTHDDREFRLKRAAAYVDRMPAAIAGQSGHDVTFNVACSLVKGFDLAAHEARPILDGYNARCSPPWSANEIEHKLTQADKVPDDKPRGYLFDADRPGYQASSMTIYTGPGHDFVIPTGEDGAPPAATLDVAAVTAHATRLAAGTVEALYRDESFLADFARLERFKPGEAAAIATTFARMPGFKARSFAKVVKAAGEAGGGANGRARGGDAPGRDDQGFTFTDMGNAHRFLAAHGHEARWCKAYGDWMAYDGTRWIQDDGLRAERWAQEVPGMIGAELTADATDEVVEANGKWLTASQGKEKLANLLVVARASVPVTPDQFDRDPWLFNVANGTIDLKTMAFRGHHSADLMTKVAPVAYDPEAKCPRWDKFIGEIMKDDPEMVAYIRRIMGYAITGIVKDHAFFVCYGGGGNGKGTLFNTITPILGDYAVDLDPDVILASAGAQHPTGLTDFEGRRLVISEETDDKRGLAEALVKRLSGGDSLRARKMRGDFYTFKPTHHLFLATNHKPNIRNNDYGLWRRLKLIPFDVTFGDPDGKKNKDEIRKPDRDLMEKLAAEASGILNWLLAGCKDWQENGLNEPEAIIRATQDYRKEMDELGWFLDEMTEDVRDDERARVIFKVLYGEYKAWAEFNGVKPIGPKKFGAQLNDRGFVTQKSNKTTYKAGLRLLINGVSVAHGPADERGDDDGGGYGSGGGGYDDDPGGGRGPRGRTPVTPDGRAAAAGGRDDEDDGWGLDRE